MSQRPRRFPSRGNVAVRLPHEPDKSTIHSTVRLVTGSAAHSVLAAISRLGFIAKFTGVEPGLDYFRPSG
jgi:hypothetical protein